MDLSSDIYLVGLGMYELQHLTQEAADVLKRVRRVFHLSDKHSQLLTLNSEITDLNFLYQDPEPRTDVYRRIAKYVLAQVQKDGPIAVAFDGNLMIFCDVSWQISAMALRVGIRVEALAGISCLDVFPAQLGFDPGDLGMQVFEATQLVMYALPIHSVLPTLVLQIGFFDEQSTVAPPARRQGAFDSLVEHLLRFFPPTHPAVFLQSAYTKQLPSQAFSTTVSQINA